MSQYTQSLFDAVLTFPNNRARSRFAGLVGLDNEKARLVKAVRLKLNPKTLEDWANEHYGGRIALADQFIDRSPLFIFAGDVGTGKTTLAETFGDVIARDEDIPVTLYRLSLNARGHGAVGEMTKLLSSAFSEVKKAAKTRASSKGLPHSAVVFLIDEADALAQSRELDQMHHEDRAGVNALIRGIDDLGTDSVPAVVVMCTNRLESIDPAVMRRAADILVFRRPSFEQRQAILHEYLSPLGFKEETIKQLARATGANGDRTWGFTYSDLIHRFMQALLIDAAPNAPIEPERALELVEVIEPTPPFGQNSAVTLHKSAEHRVRMDNGDGNRSTRPDGTDLSKL